MPTAHKALVRAGESALSCQLKSNTDNSNTKEISGTWSEAEHKLFLQGLEQHGRKWKKIAAVVGTRTKGQVQSHAQNYFAKLKQKDEGRKKSNVSWDERFQQLVEYKDQNGHCRVPQNYKANPELGSWVSMQRVAYRKQSGRKITEEQINRLEEIGFVWVLRVLQKQEHSVGWDERFKQLKEYKEQNGHCRVPQKYKANTQLGNWVNNQRRAYKKGKISSEQKDLLEGIGFVWELPRGRRRS